MRQLVQRGQQFADICLHATPCRALRVESIPVPDSVAKCTALMREANQAHDYLRTIDQLVFW